MKILIIPLLFFFTLKVIAQTPSYVPTNGLVGWWPFNGNANDESGNGNHGTVNGATLTADRNGNSNTAFDFNGTNSHISINNSICNFGVSDFTMSAWIYKYDLLIGGSVVGKRNSTGDGNMLILGSNPSYEISTGAGDYTNGPSVPQYSNINSWFHITLVRSGNNLKSYTNGILVDNNITTTIHNINNSAITEIGARYSGSSIWNLWHGKIDDILIYNRAITQQEIAALYQGCTTPTATITPQSNTNFCQGNNVVLNATTGTNYTYEWYKNSSLINGATTNSYTATTAGNYTVKVIDGSCNATSSATTLTLIDTVTWTGNVDNDWHKPCNWSPEVVPECCNSVKIPFTPISPLVSGVGKAKNVTLYSTSGATLTVNTGANLQIETCPVNKTENSCPALPVLTTSVISSATQTSAVSGGNITYTGASSITARGVCWSTTTAPTTANSKSTDGSGTGTFTSNLTSLTAGTTYYVRAYATNSNGTSYGNEVSFIAVNPQPAYPLGSVFCNGTPTLVVDVTNPTTGKTWMDRNLGASQAATSSTDPLAYGDLYQWGRGSDGHQCRNSSTTSVLSSTDQPGHGNFILAPNSPLDWRSPQNTNLWQGTNGVNNPCPSGYRIPTKIELINETNNWNSNNYIDDAFISILKFSIGGWRGNSVNLHSGAGLYWSSDLSQSNFVGQSKHLSFSNSTKVISDNERSSGMSVRCIKN